VGRSFQLGSYYGKPFKQTKKYYFFRSRVVCRENQEPFLTYNCIVIGNHIVVTEPATMNDQSILFSVSNDQCWLSRDSIEGILDEAATLKNDF
jgi:hypothetical protein